MLRRLLPVFATLFAMTACAAEPPAPAPAAEAPAPTPVAAAADETAPATYKVLFTTSKGEFTVDVNREWAPKGADRFYTLVKNGFFDDVRLFRVIRTPNPFMVQFGISGDPAVSAKWGDDTAITDDPVTQSNTRGMMTFATKGPNTRTTQVFINFGDNSFLDSQGFSPFGKVSQEMEVVDKFNAEYGEAGSPTGPDPFRIEAEGNAYLKTGFPNMDYVMTARIVGE